MTAESNPTSIAAVIAPDAPSFALSAPLHARAWIEIDHAALLRNATLLSRRSAVPLLPMIKADAYGHGAIAVARTLRTIDPWGFGVASVAEGVELRDAGIREPIVIFTPVLADELPNAHRAELTPTLHRADDIAAWSALGGGAWHLAVDTGMSRAGVRWDAVGALGDAIAAHPPEGAFTHFHSADANDANDANDASIREQELRFRDALASLPVQPRIVHAENSPAMLRRAPSPWTIARPGIGLYGVSIADAPALEPVAHVRARVVDLRVVRDGETVSYGGTWRASGDRVIATVPCGYADGYRRNLGNRAHALLNGALVPVAGVVTMDMTMLDVTNVPCALGDVVTLLGRDGDDLLDADRVASAGGLSPYELLAGLRLRLPRFHAGAAA